MPFQDVTGRKQIHTKRPRTMFSWLILVPIGLLGGIAAGLFGVGGGIVMVMMCDLMVSTVSTRFYYPEAKLGLTGGMISSLVTRMPHKLAMEIMTLTRFFAAMDANRSMSRVINDPLVVIVTGWLNWASTSRMQRVSWWFCSIG